MLDGSLPYSKHSTARYLRLEMWRAGDHVFYDRLLCAAERRARTLRIGLQKFGFSLSSVRSANSLRFELVVA